jgi:hypothetical protein
MSLDLNIQWIWTSQLTEMRIAGRVEWRCVTLPPPYSAATTVALLLLALHLMQNPKVGYETASVSVISRLIRLAQEPLNVSSQMAVMSVLRTGRSLLPRNTIFLLLVLISVRG